MEDQNGEVLEEHEERLLQKRVKRAPRKLRNTASAPHHSPSYTKPVGHSVIKAQIHGGSRSPTRTAKSTAAIGARLYAASTKTVELPDKQDKMTKLAEHVRVVKHPAPFR